MDTRRLFVCFLVLAAALFAAVPALAQLDALGGLGGAPANTVKVSGEFTAAVEGKPAYLFVTAKMKSGWHIYSITQPPGGPVKTQLTLDPSNAYRTLDSFRPIQAPEKKVEPLFDNITVESHHAEVTWYAPIELAPGADPKALRITGKVTAQPCDADSCLPPQDFPFAAGLGAGKAVPLQRTATPGEVVAPPTTQSQQPESGGDARLPWQPFTTLDNFATLVNPTFDPEQLRQNVHAGLGDSGLLWAISLAFVGGIILNLMPCVLPVIGLKVLSFVEQAGHDRRRALMLNLWYSAGLLSVFLLLAVLAASANLGWGRLYQFAGFNVTLAAIVFAMGLAFLGVWEIPIPGFVGRGKAVEIAQQEGLSAAFVKGVITTLLATPCTGPYMGTALAWTVGQPALNVFAVFLSIGLGMALPYLLIGIFPELIRFLPRPGAWMDTFKQLMGFVLLGTVVFILTFLPWALVVPTVGLMFGIWLACWFVGRAAWSTDSSVKTRAWIGAAAVVGTTWVLMFPGIDEVLHGRFAFGGLHEYMAGQFNEAVRRESALALDERLRNDGFELVKTTQAQHTAPKPSGAHTVLIAFTANWCLTCKTFEAQVLNTPEVRSLVDKNNVVTLKADWTNGSPEVTKFLEILKSNGVPVVAVFPADDPNRPTAVFRGAYTQSQVLEALEKAGPSKPEPMRTASR